MDKLYKIDSNCKMDKCDEFFEIVRNKNSYWQILKQYKPIGYHVIMEKELSKLKEL